MVSTDCAARRCGAGHAGIAIATMTSLRHRPTTNSHDRRALAEVCTVLALLVLSVFGPVRQIKRATRQHLGAGKYCLSHRIVTVKRADRCRGGSSAASGGSSR